MPIALESLETRRVPIKDLNPAPYNPRVDLQPGDPEYEDIKRSLETFGLALPLIWNERSGNLVAGHQRLKIIKNEGAQDTDLVEVKVMDVDDEKEKIANLAFNRIIGLWEHQKLGDLLKELNQNTELDLSVTGFSEFEMAQLMSLIPEGEPISPEGEWQGMPNFDQPDFPYYKGIVVRFMTEEDYKAFAELIDQNLTDKTKSIWYPKTDLDSVDRDRRIGVETAE